MSDFILRSLDRLERELHDTFTREQKIHEIVEELIEKGEEKPDDETPIEFYLRLYKMVACDLEKFLPQPETEDFEEEYYE